MTDQRWLRIIPVAFVMYTFAFVDRTNVSLALPSMSRELHMDPAQAGAASGIFFSGTCCFNFPWDTSRAGGVRRSWWPSCSSPGDFAQRRRDSYIRGPICWSRGFCLDSRKRASGPQRWFCFRDGSLASNELESNAYWMLCLPAALVCSSPVSGWILSRWNWRVLLVAEGLLPILWLIVWLVGIDDDPSQARWISAEERAFLEAARNEEARELAFPSRKSLTSSLLSRQVLIMMVISFLISTGNYGYLFWLPSMLESPIFRSGHSAGHIAVGFLNALPYIVAGISMVLISRHSDRHRERVKHIAAALLWAGVGLIASALLSVHSPVWAFGLLCLVSAGSFGIMGPFWAIPTETLPPAMAGAALGLIQVSNLGGLVGPTLIGYLNKTTGGFTSAFVVLGIGWIAAALLCALIKQPKT